MSYTILVTGASSGFGEMIAYALADAGHCVYASMRETCVRNAGKVERAATYANDHKVQLQTIELDVVEEESVDSAVAQIVAQRGRIDVVIHNAGHMVLGPSEAFTPEQYAELYDVNVIGCQRVNRAALPHMRRARSGLLVWISSTSVRGGTPPYLAPYFAAKAAMESLAMSYAGELALWGIETSIVAPGAFTKGTNHFEHSGRPKDGFTAGEYLAGPTESWPDDVEQGHAAVQSERSDVREVANAVRRVIELPLGKRPLHVTVDPCDMGYEVMAMMGDRIRSEVYHRMGLENLLVPRAYSRGL